jgi:predicted TPR repeat methyltransferase
MKLQQAIERHQAGDLDEAERLYREILAGQPAQADALHLLGLIHYARDDAATAAELIRRAIGHAPGTAVYHFNLGNVCRALADAAAALAAYRAAIALAPDEADYHNNLGTLHEALDERAAARDCYRRAVALNADDAELHLNLGNALRALGDADAALASYRQAMALAPGAAATHRAIADLHSECARAAAALPHYRRALELDPDDAALHVDLGACLQRLGHIDEAVVHYRAALALQADLAEAHNNLGALHQARGELAQAAACYRAALAADPSLAEAHRNYASVLEAAGDTGAALTHYGEALRLNPADTAAAYQRAALRGEAAPDAAPADYVAQLFDQYADSFDAHLTEDLGYRVPQLLRALLDGLGEPRSGMRVLDLGCGTGLSGLAFRDCAAHLAGVDLSPRMIERARARGVYDELAVGEVVGALRAREAHWDLLIAADVFVYLGDLAAVLRAAARSLRPGGRLLFSVEAFEEAHYGLRAAGRYAHSAGYVRDLAEAAGLRVDSERAAVLRRNFGADVQGLLFALRKTASPEGGS